MIIDSQVLERELIEKNLSGIPSKDQAWKKHYTERELGIKTPEMSLSDYIYEKNKNRLNLTALNYFDVPITYEQLFEEIDKTGKRFQENGVKEEDYVALALPTTPEAIYMIYGLDKIGGCASLIDPRVPEDRMRYYLELTGAKIAGITQPFIRTMRNASIDTNVEMVLNIPLLDSLDEKTQRTIIKEKYPSFIERQNLLLTNIREELKNLLHNTGAFVGKRSRIVPYSKFKKCGNTDLIVPEHVVGRKALGEFTSGTTGIPKGLELSAESMNVTVEQLSIINDAKPGETILAIMPPFISYGAVTGIHNSLSCGFEMILIPKFTVEIFAELIKKYKPNNIICVPSMFQYVMNSPLMENENLYCLKRLIFGGDRTTPEFEREVNEWLKKHDARTTLIKGGGMAEYSSCAFETPYEQTKKEGIYGIPLPLVEAKIMKDDYTECGYYEIGEIYIHAPQQMNGYINNQEATNEFFYTDENGKKWGRTGDLGYVDTDGCFVHTGRKKQMIVRPDGHNVFPIEIENVINKTGFVKNCVVIGIKDPETVTGEYPHAFIELKENYLPYKDQTLKKIQQAVEKQIPLRDRPKNEDYYLTEVIFAKEGKLDREATMKKVIK